MSAQSMQRYRPDQHNDAYESEHNPGYTIRYHALLTGEKMCEYYTEKRGSTVENSSETTANMPLTPGNETVWNQSI
jgi:hypothetical protein